MVPIDNALPSLRVPVFCVTFYSFGLACNTVPMGQAELRNSMDHDKNFAIVTCSVASSNLEQNPSSNLENVKEASIVISIL